MNYAVRISRAYEQIQEVVVRIEGVCKNLVVYQHDADEEVSRTHCHMLLVSCEVSTDTLKNWFKKQLGDVNKTDWSFKAAATELDKMTGFMTYCSKGHITPRFNNLVDGAAVAELTAAWVDPGTQKVKLKDGKLVREVDDAKVVSKREILELIIAEVGDTPRSTKDVLSGIRTVLMKNKCVIGQYKVLDYYDSYMMYNQKEAWLDILASRIDKRDSRG